MSEIIDMPAEQVTSQRGGGNRARNRFVFRFFVVGTLVPVVLLVLLYQTPLGESWIVESVLRILGWIIWPSAVLMMDAEHAPEIVFMLLIAAPLNGVWYSVVGLVIWHVRRLAHGHSGGPPSGDSPPVS